jgi:hypothetical protein
VRYSQSPVFDQQVPIDGGEIDVTRLNPLAVFGSFANEPRPPLDNVGQPAGTVRRGMNHHAQGGWQIGWQIAHELQQGRQAARRTTNND